MCICKGSFTLYLAVFDILTRKVSSVMFITIVSKNKICQICFAICFMISVTWCNSHNQCQFQCQIIETERWSVWLGLCSLPSWLVLFLFQSLYLHKILWHHFLSSLSIFHHVHPALSFFTHTVFTSWNDICSLFVSCTYASFKNTLNHNCLFFLMILSFC